MASDHPTPDYPPPTTPAQPGVDQLPPGAPPAPPRSHAPSRTNMLRVAAAALIVLGLAVLAWQLGGNSAKSPAPPPATPTQAATPSTQPGPSFDVVRVDQAGNTVIAGRAQPGATVTILDDGKPLGTAIADAQGAFVFLPTTPLGVGAHEITLSEALPNGQSLTSAQTAEVSVPANGGQVLTVLSGPTGSTVLSGQGPAAGTLALGAVDYDANGHAIFSGTAPEGTTIELHIGNSLLGTAKADASGHWHLAAATPTAPGTLTLSGETASGAILTPVTQPFAPESLAAALEAGQIVIVPGDNLWLIARHIYGNGLMYTLIYTANSSQIQNPNLIFPGQAFVLPKPKG